MDCIVWAHNIVVDGRSSQATTMPTVNESGMLEEELHNILNVSLINKEVDKTAQARKSWEQSRFQLMQSSMKSDAENTEDDSDEGEIQMLHCEHANAIEGSMSIDQGVTDQAGIP